MLTFDRLYTTHSKHYWLDTDRGCMRARSACYQNGSDTVLKYSPPHLTKCISANLETNEEWPNLA